MSYQRTRDGMATAKARGQLKGRKPKLSPTLERLLVDLYRDGAHSLTELMELFGASRTTIYSPAAR